MFALDSVCLQQASEALGVRRLAMRGLGMELSTVGIGTCGTSTVVLLVLDGCPLMFFISLPVIGGLTLGRRFTPGSHWDAGR